MSYLNRPQSEVPEAWRDVGITITTHLDMTTGAGHVAPGRSSRASWRALSSANRGQTGPDVRRVSLRTELFDLPTPQQATRGSSDDTVEES